MLSTSTSSLLSFAVRTGTAEPSPGASTTPDDTVRTAAGSVDLGEFALAALLCAVAVVATVMGVRYLDASGKRFYTTLTDISLATGRLQRSAPVAPTGMGAVFTGTSQQTVVEGPPEAAVGTTVTFSIATLDGTPPPAVGWTVEPSTSVKDVVQQPTSVAFVPTTEGTITVSASWDGQVGGVPTTSVVPATLLVRPAAAPEGSEPSIPFVASGFLTVILAPLLLAVAGVLALTGTLSGAAVALLSSALGFLFGQAAGKSGQGTGSS